MRVMKRITFYKLMLIKGNVNNNKYLQEGSTL